ncbi:MAG: putative bifunctional DNA primase/polymerase [Prokaryotic dsDNA virus sp.]|nr:MAG: putative bifunctional DNA primase/polymerase [Prokaryotic dsDNA virus sp.]|tara:strand:- start:22787 stop:24919 length:2133 start_codon:yes stop_codon:yes gene_type:complete
MNIYKEYVDDFIDKGMSVIPDKFAMKQPAIKGWTEYCDRKPTKEEVLQWKTSFDKTNIALCTGKASGIIAVDMDCIDPEIVKIINQMTIPSPVEKVGGKGWTRFYRYDEAIKTCNIKYRGQVVIEILAEGKKTTLPPSRHPSGTSYKWTNKSLLDIDITTLPKFPTNFIPNLNQKLLQLSGSNVAESFTKVVNGRNDEMVKYCSNLIRDKVPINEAIFKLITQDKEKHETPLFTDSDEYRHDEPFTNALMLYTNCLQSFNTKRFSNSQSYEIPIIPRIERNKGEDGEGKCSRGNLQKKLKPVLPKPEGVLAVIMNYILRNSYIEQPAFAFSASLSLMATLCGRKFEFEGVAPNLYILNVAPSGAGKNAPQEKIKEALIDSKLEFLLGAGDYVSDASLMDTLPESPVRLDIIDEAGGLLSTVNKGGSPYNTKMADILAELYTSSTSIFLGRQTAVGHKGRSIRPNVNLLCSTTPRGLSEGVSTTSIEKGLMGRFLIFKGEYNKKARRVENPISLSPKEKDYLTNLAGHSPDEKTDEVAGIKQDITKLQATEKAHELLQKYFEELDSLRTTTDSDNKLLPIISRLYQQMLKIAMIHAVSRQFLKKLKIVVDVEDVVFANQTIKYYYSVVQEVIGESIFDNQYENNRNKIVTIIKSTEDKGIAKQELTKKVRHLKKREREEIIEDLIESEEIELVAIKREKTNRTIYAYRSLE